MPASTSHCPGHEDRRVHQAGGDPRDVVQAPPGALVAEHEVLGGDPLGVANAARQPARQQADPGGGRARRWW
jgi:hypothetical protein